MDAENGQEAPLSSAPSQFCLSGSLRADESSVELMFFSLIGSLAFEVGVRLQPQQLRTPSPTRPGSLVTPVFLAAN